MTPRRTKVEGHVGIYLAANGEDYEIIYKEGRTNRYRIIGPDLDEAIAARTEALAGIFPVVNQRRCVNPRCRKPFVPKKRAQETCGENCCRQAAWRRKNPARSAALEAESRQRARERAEEMAFGPFQSPLVPESVWRAWEDRERSRWELECLLEVNESVIGKTLKGRVGTSMGGQGGIAHWAQPMYRAAREKEAATRRRRQKESNP